MKKVLALVLALVLVFSMSATAFASNPEAASEPTAGTATEVKLITSAQISITLPLNVTLAVAADGAITGPSGYTITNSSVLPVKIDSATIAPAANYALTAGDNKTVIGAITLTEGRGGDPVAFSAWTASKANKPAWNLTAADSDDAAVTLSFGGTVSNVSEDITTAKTAFTITYVVSAGAHTAPD